jgi:glycosyltransferase involved in cell wall biosynthesis
MISIVVPAHNESSVIGRTLGAWASSGPAAIEVTVVCNGCTDHTADVARRFGSTIRVVESEIAGKAHALNLGDRLSRTFPRIYADADIVITLDTIQALAGRLERGDVLAVAPTPEFNLTGCSWPVRKYYEIRSRLPSAREGIGGSGVYALSEEGRRRFTEFPGIVADDMYVRLQFKPEERETLPFAKSMVFPPRTVSQLVAVRTRAYAGTFELARRFPEIHVNKGETNHRTLLALFGEPRLWPGLLIYCCVNTIARCKAALRFRSGVIVWQRDDTSRGRAFHR